MSEIANEKDREEAHVHILKPAWICDTCGKIIFPEGEDVRIRAEAVKEEREKIAILEARIAELTKPYKPNYPDSKAYISEGPGLDSFLSNNQEATTH